MMELLILLGIVIGITVVGIVALCLAYFIAKILGTFLIYLVSAIMFAIITFKIGAAVCLIFGIIIYFLTIK